MFEGRFRHIIEEFLIKDAVIDLDKYPFLDAPHSDLYEGKLGNQAIALKRWRVSKTSDDQTEKTLKVLVKRLNEWKSATPHPNILPFLGLREGSGRVPDLILPKMRCNIVRYVTENPFADKFILVHQLSEALSHLHRQNPPIVHGSIKESNVLISWDRRVVITDIGIYATFLNPEMSQDWRPSDRPRFQPPEQLMGAEVECLQPATDVWSFGMVVLQVFTGNLPYAHFLNPNTAIIQIAQGMLPPKPDEAFVSSDLWNLLISCWNYNPCLRPSMNSISPWIRVLREQQRLRRY